MSMLNWQFQRGDRLVTCGVRAHDSSFDVITLPHWNLENGAIETFADPREALQRHAVIAAGLRDAGWALASYTQ